ncbi:MAG: tetratricopeptide repeat protein [Planctomycetota bacterium]|jgi:TolB-like protein
MTEPVLSIAVLPFENLGSDPDTDYFARGFSDDLIANLTRFPTLRVVASQSSFGLDRAAIAEAAREWGLQFALEGTVRRRGDTVRVTTRLVRVDGMQALWAERFDAPIDGVFALQDEITAVVAGKLAVHLDETQLARARRAPLHDLAAYDCWLRGIDFLRRGTLEDDEESRPFFQRALEIDPGYARAHAGLSISHFNEWTCQAWHLWDDSVEGASHHAEKAVELDDADAMVHAVLARVCRFRREHARADRHAARALELNPNDAQVLIHIAIATMFGGAFDEAHELVRRAVDLNPMRPPWYDGIAGWCLFLAGDPRGGLPALELGGDSITNFAAYRAACHLEQGDAGRAAEEYARFEREYREKIAFGREPAQGEALRWAIQVEPFRRIEDSRRMPDLLRVAGFADVDVEDALRERPASMVRPAAIASPPGSVFRKDGRIWHLTYGGQAAQLVELKGFHDIARLLRAPGEPVHCLELSGAAPAQESRHEVLDAEARRDYRRRIEELQADLERAEADHDRGAAERARGELDAVIDELAKATGMGGRTRSMASDAERARSATTWRIRSAIKKIRAAHPRLGQHLANSIRTGLFCSYEPEHEPGWAF